jgi:iron complex transport system substrate-binding protein
MRVVSLLPAATEIVLALGLGHLLVGISHECEQPAGLPEVPRVTRCDLHEADLPSAEIDRRVRETLAARGTLYELDVPLLAALAPDVILAQRLCDVCAVGYGSVAAAAATLPVPPRLVNLEPRTLADVFGDIRRVAEALGAPQRGQAVVAGLTARVDAVCARAAAKAERPRCLLLEWIDPLFCSGHWNPELVSLAGGEELLGRVGEPSRQVEWEEVLHAQPEVLLIVCCGYSVERTLQDLPLLQRLPGWADLPAVRSGRVFVGDGTAHFTVPGPRLVDSLELVEGALRSADLHEEHEAGEGGVGDHPAMVRIAATTASTSASVLK